MKHHHLLNMERVLCFQANLQLKLWEKCSNDLLFNQLLTHTSSFSQIIIPIPPQQATCI